MCGRYALSQFVLLAGVFFVVKAGEHPLLASALVAVFFAGSLHRGTDFCLPCCAPARGVGRAGERCVTGWHRTCPRWSCVANCGRFPRLCRVCPRRPPLVPPCGARAHRMYRRNRGRRAVSGAWECLEPPGHHHVRRVGAVRPLRQTWPHALSHTTHAAGSYWRSLPVSWCSSCDRRLGTVRGCGSQRMGC